MLTMLYGAVMLPCFFLLVLVSWPRVVLRRHTVLQGIVGNNGVVGQHCVVGADFEVAGNIIPALIKD